jgi:hypothetical protein
MHGALKKNSTSLPPIFKVLSKLWPADRWMSPRRWWETRRARAAYSQLFDDRPVRTHPSTAFEIAARSRR